jgi:hypothetical protein
MLLNILMYFWFITYLFTISIGVVQMYRGKFMTWRDSGFLFLGFGLSFIPFFWLIHQHI